MFSLLSSTATLVNPQISSAFHDTIVNLLNLGLLALVAGANWALKMWLSSMKTGWKKAIAERAVKYAEQKFVDNTQRQQEAASMIAQHFPRLSQDEVSHLIEEAVVNLKAQMAQPVAAPVLPSPTVTSGPVTPLEVK